MDSAGGVGPGGSGEAVTTLRGAPVASFDVRRLGRVLVGLVALTLAVLVGVFTWVGIHHNDQVDEIRDHGVRAVMSVTSCLGELGGSGSNIADYICTGTYRLDGRVHHATVPGSGPRAKGAEVAVVVDPADPGHVVSPHTAATARTSASVFAAPVAMAVALVALLVVVAALRRSKR